MTSCSSAVVQMCCGVTQLQQRRARVLRNDAESLESGAEETSQLTSEH